MCESMARVVTLLGARLKYMKNIMIKNITIIFIGYYIA